MTIDVRIIDGPVPAPLRAWAGGDPDAAAGAVVTFLGVVRAQEQGRPIVALDYQAYEPMATRQLLVIARELASASGLIRVGVTHSRGRVPVGAASLRVEIASPHRAEALETMGRLLDRLKREVPIWKTPVYPGT